MQRLTGLLTNLLTGLVMGVLLLSLVVLPAKADLNLNPQTAVSVSVELGKADGALRFSPDTLTFQAGQLYKLALSNPSNQKHYFTAKDFADAVWTRNIKAGGVEIKGAIHDLELKPGAQAEWSFVPLRSGTYTLRCTVPGHTEAGMVGILTVRS
ncbi:plastocyanin/azurin family copper-binding protein [Leptolyngbya sp. FACHB-261]|uniref:plastocyanin/azurin family copper-binding protein n=1 Tax=Leptolyngbya sp. FACHB-261 TaxID=2692806 RepID=UPI001684A151|nr:plastocyanin/azurin family copper-binding protein [Leptolyngbya sp. FACHB-261]MBD2100514.1 biphenyl 2,3-dioxygenase [Leptolyngbya sp. FACHB-261]